MSDHLKFQRLLKCASVLTLLTVSMFAAACGSDEPAKAAAKPFSEALTSDDVERDLKFDARVADFDTDGDTLTVDVNEHWMSSPAGMQQTALKRWFTRWQAAREAESGKAPKGAEIVVRYDGNEILRATDAVIKVFGKKKEAE